jgi:hypothetical protein
MNGADASSGMNWTLAVDPIRAEVVYTNSGTDQQPPFGNPNGGGDWQQIWPPPLQPDLAKAFQYNFATSSRSDTVQSRAHPAHLPRGVFAPHTSTCIARGLRGSWKLIDGKAGWSGGEGQVIFFPQRLATWLWGSQTNGYSPIRRQWRQWDPIAG